MLDIKNLDVGYGSIQVLWDITLDVGNREVVSLIGANGAGKTTLIRAISGILKPKRGSIDFAGRTINTMIPSDRVVAGILQVPEGRKLFSGMNVHENLVMGGYALKDRKMVKENLDYVYGLFPELVTLRRQAADTLSGGQQQMVAIARALMGSPKLLLVDEFSLGLAPVVVERLAEAIRVIQSTRDVAILMVEQDVQLGLELSSRAYVLETGKMAMFGDSKDLMKNPVIREAYLGI
jgi:branched-chain amino acid transport system ATP-binding protein